MRSRRVRRLRAGIAVPVALALGAAALGVGAASPAQAASPTYTVTTGATGTYSDQDDTPAMPFIDGNGTFYYQSSHSLYGATDGRAWDFFTGSDFDTATADQTLDADNSNTTALCNSSPTGVTSTPDPSTASYAEPNYCDLIGVWVDPDTGNWYGLVHNEFTPSPFNDGNHYDDIDYAISTNKGQSWTIESHVITTPFSTNRSSYQGWTDNAGGTLTQGTTCLDIYEAGSTSGTPVDTYSCDGNANQVWSVTGGTVVNPKSNLCLTASGTTTGSTFTIATCGASNALQKFSAPATATAHGQIKLTGTSMCVDLTSTLKLAACVSTADDGSTEFPNQTYYFGGGDPKLYTDYASGYFYIFYDSQIYNIGGGGNRADFGHVARAPIADKMAPDSWQKWYDGSWSQPGVGGDEADLIPSDGTSSGYLDDAYNPANTGTVQQQVADGELPGDVAGDAPLAWMDVAWDAYLGEYISTARPENPTTSTPLEFYATKSLATEQWVAIGSVTDPSGGSWYRSLLDSVSLTSKDVVGETFRDYCMYSCTASVGSAWVSTTISSTGLPARPVSSGTAYQIAAGDGEYLAQSGSSLTTTSTGSASAAQGWKFTPTGDGFFTIANVSTGQNLGVNDSGNSGRAWGASLLLGTGTSVGYQWYIQAVDDPGLPSGSYRLVNRYSGQALSLTSGSGGVATAPQRDWTNTGTSGDTHAVNAQTLTFLGNSTNTVTAANPGARQAPLNTAITPLQIHATDSAGGQSLTYSATGLPAGLSINSSTGSIAGTPTTTGTSAVTVTVTDATGAYATTAFTWTTGSPNLIPTGDLNGALPGWSVTNAGIVTDPAAHTGTNDLRLKSPSGGYATMEYTVTGLSPDTAYTYTGWVRAGTGASTSFGVKGYGGAQVTTHTTSTSWTQLSDVFTTGAASTSATVFCYLPSSSATSSCDDLSLTAN